MEFSSGHAGLEAPITDLFGATFTASEGAEEGALIGTFVRRLLDTTPPPDLRVFTAREEGRIIGAAVFSRLTYSDDPRAVFLLSPMAVATDRQGQGIGQALIRHGLAVLRDDGVAVAITYGDPAFYGRVGFLPLDPATTAPPLPLGMPEGWIGQSLTGEPLHPLRGGSTCVPALNDPALW